jgi:branched-chain amino acid aminotransferase
MFENHFIFFNNKLLEANNPMTYIPWNDRGIQLGDGLFETIRIKNGKIYYLEDHYQRLIQSANLLSLSFEYSIQDIEKILFDLLAINHFNETSCYARITLTRGIGERGLNIPLIQNPTFLVVVSPFNYQLVENYTLKISDTIRKNEFSITSKIKSTSYLDFILARQEAILSGANDALLLNSQGFIAEASTANIFVRVDDHLITPMETNGILPGIMRKNILKISEKIGLNIIEKSIMPKDLSSATEIFLTNALMPIQPVSKILDIWEPQKLTNAFSTSLLGRDL